MLTRSLAPWVLAAAACLGACRAESTGGSGLVLSAGGSGGNSGRVVIEDAGLTGKADGSAGRGGTGGVRDAGNAGAGGKGGTGGAAGGAGGRAGADGGAPRDAMMMNTDAAPMRECSLATQKCANNQGCYRSANYGTKCRPAGFGVTGNLCTEDQDCFAGYVCVFDFPGQPGACREVCSPVRPCPNPDLVCNPLPDYSPAGTCP